MDPITLNSLKAQVAVFLTDHCTISAEVHGTDDFGAVTHEMQTVATNVACRLIRGDRVRLAEFGLQEVNRETYRLIVGPDVKLAKGQRVTIDESSYEILGIRKNLTDGLYSEALIGRLE